MLLQDLIVNFRKQIGDEASPYLVDDDEALLFAIDAQDRLVIGLGGISDYSTTALTDIALVANQPMSSFSRYILRFRSAKLLTAKRSVEFISESGLAQKAVQDYGFVLPSYLDDNDTGDVRAAILGIEDYKLRFWHVPNASDTLRCHIYRLPYPRITTQEDTLEIEEQHHIHLIPWMKFMAYSKQDAELYDKDAAESNKKLFESYVIDAADQKNRQRYKPRVVQYGGL